MERKLILVNLLGRELIKSVRALKSRERVNQTLAREDAH